MGCSKGCNSNPCACNIVPLPYYEDPCFQDSQNQGCQVFKEYSPVLRVSTEWAVPEGANIVTLNVVALSDILIGATIWNPEYGEYEVVSYDQDGSSIKVVKTLGNEEVVGTVIPACSKFLVIKPTADIDALQAEIAALQVQISGIEITLDSLDTFSTFTPNPVAVGAGTLTNIVVDHALFSVYGERTYIIIAIRSEIIGGTVDYIEFDLPYQAATVGPSSQAAAGALDNGGLVDNGSFRVNSDATKCRVYRSSLSALVVSAEANFSANFFYKRQV